MTDHLGYEKHDQAGAGSGNVRNGTRSKTVLTGQMRGPVRDTQLRPAVYRTGTLATDWMLDEAATPDDVPLARLHSPTEPAQRTWFAAYLDAAHRCDIPALIRLDEQL